MGAVEQDTDTTHRHVDKGIGLVDVAAIRARHFNVVLDGCNGAGSVISPLVLDALDCSVAKINCELTGLFPHNPEPLNENLVQLSEAVQEFGSDIGFAHDADADRVAVVTDG